MMSHSYKKISISSDVGVAKSVFLGLGVLFFLFLIAAGNLFSVDAEFLGERIVAEAYRYTIQIVNSDIAVKACALVLLLAFFRYNDILISCKTDDTGSDLEEANAYEVFEKIIRKAGGRWKIYGKSAKYIINVEDLDRVEDKKDVIEFLKLLYKYNNLLTEKEKKQFIFVVSLSMRNYAEMQEEKLRDKIFDYIMVLRPLNLDMVIHMFENLLEEKEVRVRNSLGTTDKKWQEWLIKGKAQEIRTIKSRFNNAMEILDELLISKERGEILLSDDGWALDFKKCMIVSYLEDEYPLDTYYFVVKGQSEFQLAGKDKNAFLKALDQQQLSWKFKWEIKELFRQGLGVDDYWIYFHRNPRPNH